jgi:hypothetical protein
MTFTTFLPVGAYAFCALAFSYLSMQPGAPSSYPTDTGMCIFGQELCAWLSYDFWTLSFACMAAGHAFWTACLAGMHLYQISVNVTSNEQANAHKYAYLTHPDDVLEPPFRRRYLNPFDLGVLANCYDFWSGGNSNALRDVSWFTATEVPPKLLARQVWRTRRCTDKKCGDRKCASDDECNIGEV